MWLCHGWGWHPPQTTSHSHIYNMFEHFDMLSIGIQQQPYTVLPTILGSDFEVLGHLWSQHDVIMSLLRLTATSNWFPHLHYTYRKSLSTLICCALAYSKSLTQIYPSNLAHILRFFCVTCGVKMMSLCLGWGCQPPQTASHIHIIHIDRNCDVLPKTSNIHSRRMVLLHEGGGGQQRQATRAGVRWRGGIALK